jgi:hypothetical protein
MVLKSGLVLSNLSLRVERNSAKVASSASDSLDMACAGEVACGDVERVSTDNLAIRRKLNE